MLFNRHKKQVTPTQAGEQLLEITRKMFDNEQQALELLTESRALRSGTLRIVADAAHHLLHILGRFREAYPGVQVSLRAGNSETVIRNLYSYDADIGVLGDMPMNRDFDVLVLNSTPIIAFAAAGSALARRKSLSFEALADLPLVMREQGSRTRRKLEEGAMAAGVKLMPSIEAEGREAVREIVAAGAGIGFVSQAEFGSDQRLARITIDGPAMLMDEALVALRERAGGKLVRAFMETARTFLPKPEA